MKAALIRQAARLFAKVFAGEVVAGITRWFVRRQTAPCPNALPATWKASDQDAASRFAPDEWYPVMHTGGCGEVAFRYRGWLKQPGIALKAADFRFLDGSQPQPGTPVRIHCGSCGQRIRDPREVCQI